MGTEAKRARERMVPVRLSMPAALVQRIDDAARDRMSSRSQVVRQLVAEGMDRAAERATVGGEL